MEFKYAEIKNYKVITIKNLILEILIKSVVMLTMTGKKTFVSASRTLPCRTR